MAGVAIRAAEREFARAQSGVGPEDHQPAGLPARPGRTRRGEAHASPRGRDRGPRKGKPRVRAADATPAARPAAAAGRGPRAPRRRTGGEVAGRRHRRQPRGDAEGRRAAGRRAADRRRPLGARNRVPRRRDLRRHDRRRHAGRRVVRRQDLRRRSERDLAGSAPGRSHRARAPARNAGRACARTSASRCAS